SWRLREQLGSEEREVRAVMVRKCRPRSMRRPVRILCAPRVTLTHQTNRVKVYRYSRQRQGLFKSVSAPSEENWRATMNLQMFDDGWKIAGPHTRLQRCERRPVYRTIDT